MGSGDYFGMTTQAYYDWVRKGKPYTVAKPIQELVALAQSARVAVLGTIGNNEHLLSDNPQDHTPYPLNPYPVKLPGYVVTACDLAYGPHGDQLVADARAGKLPWVKYINHRNVHWDRRDGWKGTYSSDVHLHVSLMSDHITNTIGNYNPFQGGYGMAGSGITLAWGETLDAYLARIERLLWWPIAAGNDNLVSRSVESLAILREIAKKVELTDEELGRIEDAARKGASEIVFDADAFVEKLKADAGFRSLIVDLVNQAEDS